jgi:NAD(P)-dependent dehydrogenase (short-subunit alcohol dehydrogenase family)
MDLGLDKRIVFVTGGGLGVGRVICKTLATEGACVAVNDLVSERADAVAREICDAGGTAISVVGDITELETVRSMVAATNAALGPIDILINNAGVVPERRTGEVGLPLFVEMQEKYWDKIIGLNVYGVMNTVAAIGPDMMARRRGKILSIISDAGRVGEARMAVYSGAKAAVLGFTKALAKEFGKFCINVNTVSLSAVAHESPVADFLRLDATPETNDMLRKILRQYPIGEGLGRLTRPEDAANAVAFLVSDRAEFITGQCLPVNGGFAM